MEIRNNNLELQALQRGEEGAFDALFRQWYAPLCHYASTLTARDIDAAEDIVQNAFIKLWEQRERIDIKYSVKAYLYKAVHNACLNRIRDKKTVEKYQQHQIRAMENSYVPEPETELAERIKKAIEELPAQCRRIFELSRFEELKYREIAEQLNISPKTVENQMGRALSFLRLKLADYLVSIVLLWFHL